MDREELIKGAYQWIDDGDCDVYNEPGEAMADFHLAKSAEWNLIYTEKDNPTELGWYLVSVLEMNDLGAFRYTDIISFGHRAEIGNCWFIQSDKQRVVAWRSRPDPYRELTTDRRGARRGFMDKVKWIPTKVLLPQSGMMRIWQTASELMFIGYLSDDKRLVYLSDDDTRYVHTDYCVAHRRMPNSYKANTEEKHDG